MLSPLPKPLFIGTHRVDLERGLLLDDQQRPVPLRPRAWQVLQHLALRCGHVVTKDELMAQVWPDSFVTDDSLVQTVVEIRRALGAGARDALLTLPRRGYMLVATSAGGQVQQGAAATAARPAATARGDAPAHGSTVAAAGRQRDELAARATQVFVGRRDELRRLAAVLQSPPDGKRVALVVGAGGIGKSTLLSRVKALCEALQVPVFPVDASLVEPTAASMLAALSEAVGLPSAAASVRQLAAGWPAGPSVLAIDGAERVEALQALLRDQLLLELPGAARIVIASRRRPDPDWHAHPLWGPSIETIELGGLTQAESLDLLGRLGVPSAARAVAAALAHGHPLTLALLAREIHAQRAVPERLDADTVRVLVNRCVGDAPSHAHRRLLQAATFVDRVTEDMIVRVVSRRSAAALYDWLAGQSYVRQLPDGLAVHDLVRDAVEQDLRQRDPGTADLLRTRACRYLTDRMRRGTADAAASVSLSALLRHVPAFSAHFDPPAMVGYWLDDPTAADQPRVDALLAQGLPPGERAIFGHWASHAAARVQLLRGPDDPVCGLLCTLRLDQLRAADAAPDPLVTRALEALGTPLAGKSIMARFAVPKGERGPKNPAMNALQRIQSRAWATERGLRHWVICSVHPQRYADLFEQFAFAPLAGCSTEIDGVPIGCFVHDWIADPWDRWLERISGIPSTRAQGPGAGLRR